MAEIRRFRMEDENENVYYPHTSSLVTFMEDGKTLEETMADVDGKITQMGEEVALSSVDNFALFTKSTKMVAHRGVCGYAPENTLPAYELAGKLGYFGAETDLQLTSDGHFILMHDTTVDGTTNGTGLVSSKTLAQIKELTVDFGKNINNYPNLKVPTFEEFLEVCIKWNLTPVIEVKSMAVEHMSKLVNIIKTYNLTKKVVIISFDMPLMIEIRRLDKDICVAPLVDFTDINIELCAKLKNSGISVAKAQVTKELCDKAHKRGLGINVWTVNDNEEALRLKRCGCNFITTDKLL